MSAKMLSYHIVMYFGWCCSCIFERDYVFWCYNCIFKWNYACWCKLWDIGML